MYNSLTTRLTYDVKLEEVSRSPKDATEIQNSGIVVQSSSLKASQGIFCSYGNEALLVWEAVAVADADGKIEGGGRVRDTFQATPMVDDPSSISVIQ